MVYSSIQQEIEKAMAAFSLPVCQYQSTIDEVLKQYDTNSILNDLDDSTVREFNRHLLNVSSKGYYALIGAVSGLIFKAKNIALTGFGNQASRFIARLIKQLIELVRTFFAIAAQKQATFIESFSDSIYRTLSSTQPIRQTNSIMLLVSNNTPNSPSKFLA